MVSFRQNLFVVVALLGCVAPWVTPRLFPLKEPPAMGLRGKHPRPTAPESIGVARALAAARYY